MAITAKDVMTLRQRTGLGMMECKKALTAADGDMEAAIAKLREELKGKMDERSEREAAEGMVAAAVRNGEATLVELISETDFAARNEGFVAATKQIAEKALSASAGDVEPTDEMKAVIDQLRITIKENISLRRAHKLVGEKIGSYVHHNGQVGVIIKGEGDLSDELLTGVCQHIAANVPAPMAVDRDGLPADELQKQQDLAVKEAKDSGKPEQIAQKIAEGKIRKWVDDNTLLGQIYLREMDAKKPVGDYIPEGAKITGFVKYAIKG